LSGANFVPRRFTQLFDTPESFLGYALQVARVKADETALEFANVNIDPFAWASDWVNLLDYGAAGVITTTTLAAQLTAGSTSATLTDASSFEAGHGMAIPGAGAAGVELAVVLTDVTGNVVSWTGATSTTVASGTTVHHDDTVAIKAALASGKSVYPPQGSYNVLGGGQDTIRLAGFEGQAIRGINDDYVNGTVIYNRSTTKDVFRLVKRYTQIKSLAIVQGAGVTPTAGAAIVLGDNTAATLSGGKVNQVVVVGCYDGMRVEYANNSYVEGFITTANKHYGMYCSSPPPTGGSYFSSINIHHGGNGATVGIYMDQFDTHHWTHINVIGFPINVHMRAELGYINTQIIASFTIENATNIGVKLEGVGGYLVRWVEFGTGEILTGGAYIGEGVEDASFNGTAFIAPTGWVTSGVNGIRIYGKRTQLNGVNVGQTGYPAINYDAVHIYSTAEGTKINGGHFRKCRYGLAIDDGAVGTVIKGAEFEGETGTSILGTSVAEEMNIRNNSRFTGNIGLDDFGPSISYTPGWRGQRAQVGGHEYVATGTSSAADWKQTTV
jgi:hypothetical protein